MGSVRRKIGRPKEAQYAEEHSVESRCINACETGGDAVVLKDSGKAAETSRERMVRSKSIGASMWDVPGHPSP